MEPETLKYDDLIEALKSILPEKVLYGDLIGAEGAFAHSGPLVYEDPEPYFIEQAITAITELREKLKQTTAERDKAMSFIPKTCDTCKYGKPPCDWCEYDPDGDMNWEWNGKAKEDANDQS